jgi:hypothetical protein
MNEMEQHELAMRSSIQNNLAFTPGSATKQSVYARTRNNPHAEELHHTMKSQGWQKREGLVGMGRSDLTGWRASRRVRMPFSSMVWAFCSTHLPSRNAPCLHMRTRWRRPAERSKVAGAFCWDAAVVGVEEAVGGEAGCGGTEGAAEERGRHGWWCRSGRRGRTRSQGE